MPIARVIDYETTGTVDDPDPEIVEMAFVDVDTETRKIVGEWRSFVRPRGPIPPVAKAVHHITEQDVADAPTARELWDTLLAGPPSYLVAHNARFEQHFTPDMGIPWICTYKAARVVWRDAPGHSNQALRYWLGLPVHPAKAQPVHRALPDAYVTALLFIRLMEERVLSDLVRITEFPALLHVMQFGKHKGKTFEEAPADYLRWIVEKSEMDEDVKFSARYWLKRRGE